MIHATIGWIWLVRLLHDTESDTLSVVCIIGWLPLIWETNPSYGNIYALPRFSWASPSNWEGGEHAHVH